jgi:hypothetical protein
MVPDAGTFFKYRWTKRRFFPGYVFGLAQALAFDESREAAGE